MRCQVHRVSLVVPLVFLTLLEAVAAAECPESAVRYASSSRRVYITGPVTCTLTDLDAMVSHAALQRTSAPDLTWILRASLILQQGATIRLHGANVGGDVNVLRLRSDDTGAAYILADWGTIDIDSVTVESWDETVGNYDHRPDVAGRAYILARSRLDADGVTPRESRMDIRGSLVQHLGSGTKTDTHGLAWKVYGSAPLDKVAVRGDVASNTFVNGYQGGYVYGGRDMNFVLNYFDDHQQAGLYVKDSTGVTVDGNQFNRNPSGGFRCPQGCDGLVLRNNASAENGTHGFEVRRCDTPPLIEDNWAYLNTVSNLSLIDCSGGVVRGNLFEDSKRGVRLTSGTSDTLIENNTFRRHSAALHAYPTTAAARSGDGRPARNTFRENQIVGGSRAVILGDADDTQIIANRLSGLSNLQTFVLEDSMNTVLAGNVIPSGVIWTFGSGDIEGPDTATTFITQAGYAPEAIAPVTAERAGNSGVHFVETAQITHARHPSDPSTATANETTLSMPAGQDLVTPYHIFARPDAGQVVIAPDSGTAWVIEQNQGAQAVEFTVGQLAPNTSYTLRRNGTAVAQGTTDSSGVLTVSDAAPPSTTFWEYTVTTP